MPRHMTVHTRSRFGASIVEQVSSWAFSTIARPRLGLPSGSCPLFTVRLALLNIFRASRHTPIFQFPGAETVKEFSVNVLKKSSYLMEDCSSSLLGCCRSRTPSWDLLKAVVPHVLASLQSGVNVTANSNIFRLLDRGWFVGSTALEMFTEYWKLSLVSHASTWATTCHWGQVSLWWYWDWGLICFACMDLLQAW